MSDIICTNCGGQSTTGCWLCNPDNFPGANEYADPLDKTYWAKEAGRLSAENAFLTQRLEKLQAEVVRLKADLYEGNCELEKQQRINKELQDAIREHRDSFSKDMDEHDWTTEDETLWELIGD